MRGTGFLDTIRQQGCGALEDCERAGRLAVSQTQGVPFVCCADSPTRQRKTCLANSNTQRSVENPKAWRCWYSHVNVIARARVMAKCGAGFTRQSYSGVRNGESDCSTNCEIIFAGLIFDPRGIFESLSAAFLEMRREIWNVC
jgi:hypothetical protein